MFISEIPRITVMRNLRIIMLTLFLLAPFAVQAQDLKEDFLAAARKGDVEAVKALLAKGVDVNTKTEYGATALAYACDKGHTAVVKLLLENGADPNSRDTFYQATPITWASMKGHAEIVRLLLDKGAVGKEQVLMGGVQSGKADMVRVVLEKGGVGQPTLDQALSRAVRNKNAEIAEMLRKAGAKELPKADFKVDEETLKSYAGTYKNDPLGDVTLSVKDGKLMLRIAGQPEYTMGAFDKTSFTLNEVDGVNIKFNVEGDKVTGMTLKQSGQTFEFKKTN